jgi:hypothetical protein
MDDTLERCVGDAKEFFVEVLGRGRFLVRGVPCRNSL